MTAQDKNRKFADRAVGAEAIEPEVRDGKDTKRWKKGGKIHTTHRKKKNQNEVYFKIFFKDYKHYTRCYSPIFKRNNWKIQQKAKISKFDLCYILLLY